MSAPLPKKETIDAKLKMAWHAIDRMYNKEAARHDSTSAIALVLLNIDPEHGTPATKIGPAMGLVPRGLSRVFASLEKKGLIKRKIDKIDARKNIATLTALGKKKREIAKETIKSFNNHIIQKLGEKKTETLLKLLDELQTIINEKNNQ
ncbi:MAG: winged helix-turn-helix transcriptional regulator [Bacteroidia bacterium]|nr:winged helix-turn-helix transcriptional regulator [Bacteroidia bacterium]